MYDVIIIGGGVTAFSAGLFVSRKGYKNLVLAKDLGGQANFTDLIENYPGLPAVGGYELTDIIKNQAEGFGTEFLHQEVSKIKKIEGGFVVTAGGMQYKGKSLILAHGKSPMDLKVAGEEELKGRGVSYCTNCDAPLFKNKIVAVAGVGDLALDAVLTLSKYAKKIYLLSKTDKVSGHPALMKAIARKPGVELLHYAQIEKIEGQEHVTALKILNLKTRSLSKLDLDGLFVELGYEVNSIFVQDLVELDQSGQVVTDAVGQTSCPGVFAAGDAANHPYKQAVISASEGVTAALAAIDWLNGVLPSPDTGDWTQIKKVKN